MSSASRTIKKAAIDPVLGLFTGPRIPTAPEQDLALPAQPPDPLPPPPVPSETEGQAAIPQGRRRRDRRFGIRQTILTGAPLGVAGDRPQGT